MKVLIYQFLNANHSWAHCGRGWARALKQLGHEVHLFSTDGGDTIPDDLKENIIGYVDLKNNTIIGKLPEKNYDMQLSYTAPRNVPIYLSNGTKNRFAIWCYEWKNGFPIGFAKNYKHCDFLCPPSEFANQIFIDAGISKNILKIIPHGIHSDNFKQTSVIKLTDKKFKIMANVAQCHLRKDIPGLLEAYGRSFTNKDDVCLILKGKHKPIVNQFDVSLNDCISNFKRKYPNHGEFRLYSEFIDDISILYRSVDAVFSMTRAEAFYLPGIEAMSSGKLSICPRWGGQLDFLNDSNALLIGGKEERTNPKSMYWTPNNNAIWFKPDIDDAVNKLQYAYKNYETLNSAIDKQREDVYNKYDWKTIANHFLSLCK